MIFAIATHEIAVRHKTNFSEEALRHAVERGIAQFPELMDSVTRDFARG